MKPGGASAARRRVTWNVGDQVLSTGTNFALNVLVARSVAPAEFGAFSIAYVTYLLWRGLTWSICAEPFMIRYGARPEADRQRATAGSLGAAAGLGLLAGAVTAAAAALLDGAVADALFALAVVLPPLLVQEAVRSVFLGGGRPERAVLNDAVWGVTQLVAVVALVQAGTEGGAPLLLAWGGSAALAALVGLLDVRVAPDPRRLGAWIREHRTLSPWLSMEFLLTRGASQITFYTLGWVASLGAVASLRAAQVFVGPLTVLFTAGQVSLVSEGVRLAARSPRRLRWGVIRGTWVLATISVAFGVALSLLPDRIGEQLVGDVWGDTEPLLPIMAVAVVARSLVVGAAAGSRALGEAKALLAARAIVAPVSVLAGIAGAAAFGAAGAAWSFVATSGLSAALYWRQFLRQARDAAEPDHPAPVGAQVTEQIGEAPA